MLFPCFSVLRFPFPRFQSVMVIVMGGASVRGANVLHSQERWAGGDGKTTRRRSGECTKRADKRRRRRHIDDDGERGMPITDCDAVGC